MGRLNEPWVCIGHSHAAALEHSGAPALDVIDLWVTPDPWVRDAGAIVGFRKDLTERIQAAETVLSLIGGSAHTVLGMVEHSRPFDLVLPSDQDLPVDEMRELVPAGAVRRKLIEMNDESFQAIRAISHTARGPVVHVGPPPPLSDPARIAPRVPWDHFPGQPRVVTPKWVRYKLWRLQNEIYADVCARLGVRYASAPASATDEEGFLLPCYDQDGTHANGAYGALVVEQLRSLM
jgi:hypothetical protein